MSETRYVIPLWLDTRLRHFHRTEGGRVVEFSIQLEVEVQGEYRPAIRYDTAHDAAHIDRFTRTGRRRREWLDLDFDEALVRAERDLRENWLGCRERFLRGEYA